MVKTIALTGGIGSGKSTVSQLLMRLGYIVYDADLFAREVLFLPHIASEVEALFGKGVFLEQGILNRDFVRAQIIHTPVLKKKLEDILHPAIANELKQKIQSLNVLSANAWVFYEAALIIETNKKHFFDACVVVTAEHEKKLERICASRSLSDNEVLKIMALQLSDEEKAKQADYVIDNSFSHNDLNNQVLKLIGFLYEKFSPSDF